MTTEAPTRIVLCIPDDHKKRIEDMLDSELNKDNGYIHLTDKNGVVMKFYRNGGHLWADRADGENVIPQPVIAMSEAEEFQKQARPFKEKVVERMKTDFPEKSNEEIEQDADILNEANESIKKLITAGIAPSVARKIILSCLECSAPPSTPEELAEFIGKQVEANEKTDE